jgi:MFS family permease
MKQYLTLIKTHPSLLAITFLAVFTGNLGQSFFIGLFQQPISHHFGFSAAEFGNIYSLLTLTSGFLIMHFGPKIDWVSPKRYATYLLVALIIGVLSLTLSSWWLLGIIGLGLVRIIGQGMMTHFGMTLTGREVNENRGRALSLMGLAMPSGEIILPPLIALLFAYFSWQQSWWVIFSVIILLWLSLLLFAKWPTSPMTHQAKKKDTDKSFKPLKELHFWLIMPMLLVLPMTLTGVFLYQAQLVTDLGANITTYALALTMVGLLRFPVALLGGHWLDEFGVNRLARLYLIPYALALLLAVVVEGNLGVWILLLGAGLSMSMSSPVGDSLLIKLWGTEHLGKVRSYKSSFTVLSTGITPALLGYLIDSNIDFQAILIGMLLYLIFACFLAQASIRQAN